LGNIIGRMYYSNGFLYTNFPGDKFISVSIYNSVGQLIKIDSKVPSVGVKPLHLQGGIYFISTQVSQQKISEKIMVFE